MPVPLELTLAHEGVRDGELLVDEYVMLDFCGIACAALYLAEMAKAAA
jgi:hypothetical protein